MRKRARKIKKLTVAKYDLAPGDFDGDDYEMGRWWVRDPNNESCLYSGPYTTKAEAVEARRGLERYWRYHAED